MTSLHIRVFLWNRCCYDRYIKITGSEGNYDIGHIVKVKRAAFKTNIIVGVFVKRICENIDTDKD